MMCIARYKQIKQEDQMGNWRIEFSTAAEACWPSVTWTSFTWPSSCRSLRPAEGAQAYHQLHPEHGLPNIDKEQAHSGQAGRPWPARFRRRSCQTRAACNDRAAVRKQAHRLDEALRRESYHTPLAKKQQDKVAKQNVVARACRWRQGRCTAAPQRQARVLSRTTSRPIIYFL